MFVSRRTGVPVLHLHQHSNLGSNGGYHHTTGFRAQVSEDTTSSTLGLTWISLRIRMKAETTDAKAAEIDSSASEVPPASGSDQTGTTTPEGSSTSDDETTTVQASTSSIKSAKSKAIATALKPVQEESKTDGSMVGKINNLITTDLENIGSTLR